MQIAAVRRFAFSTMTLPVSVLPSWTAFAIVAIVVVVVFTGHKSGGDSPDIGKAVPSSVMNDLTTVSASVFDAAGAKDAKPPAYATSTPAGTPQFLYMGSEFCPFCAVQRWIIVTALARFGAWHNLTLSESATTRGEVYPGTPTFSFAGTTFDSPYVKVSTVEM